MSPDRKKTIALVSNLLRWFSSSARDLPWRRTTDPYAIFVSEIMLQQTQVKTVIPFWERWMRELPTVESLADASAGRIHKLWEGLGYYTRVRNMQKAAQVIVAEHQGRFPDRFDDVLELPGIGRYTAGAICSIAFDQPTPILDGNVIRVLTRLYGIQENPREKETNARLWRLAESLVVAAKSADTDPKTAAVSRPCSSLNQSLMELGALICTPRQPKCSDCPVFKQCVARRKKLVDVLPNIEKRAAATHREFFTYVIHHKDRFLVRQRPEGVVNAHLWEFPNVEVNGDRLEPGQTLAAQFGIAPTAFETLAEIRHSITRYRIIQKVFRAVVSGPKVPKLAPGTWHTIEELKGLPLTAAHARIRTMLAEPTRNRL